MGSGSEYKFLFKWMLLKQEVKLFRGGFWFSLARYLFKVCDFYCALGKYGTLPIKRQQERSAKKTRTLAAFCRTVIFRRSDMEVAENGFYLLSYTSNQRWGPCSKEQGSHPQFTVRFWQKFYQNGIKASLYKCVNVVLATCRIQVQPPQHGSCSVAQFKLCRPKCFPSQSLAFRSKGPVFGL